MNVFLLLLGSALVVGAVALAASLVFVWRNQERIVFQPPRVVASGTERQSGRRTYRARDGQPLFGYLVGMPSADAPFVIAFHGNADLAEWLLPWAHKLCARTGASVFLPEYRGYGGLPGRPTYPNSHLDACAAWEMARGELGISESRLVLFGHSLGSAIAVELAAVARPRALVLQSPFSSARAMAARLLMPSIPALWGRVSRVHFDTAARVARLAIPVHVAHGERDLVIPDSMGRQVHGAARVHGQLLLVPDAGHNDVAERGQDRYWRWLAAAIADSR